MTSTTSYSTSAREASVQATRERILTAAIAAFTARGYEEATLRGIAADAGIALQTVVNHFGSKERLFQAVTDRVGDSIHAARWSVVPGDVRAAIATLVDDYERTAEFTLRMLALEDRVPAVLPSLERGRAGHAAWVEHVFTDLLDDLRGPVRTRRFAQLVAVTDIYTWKLLRRDKGLDRDQTITAMHELAAGLNEHRPGGRSG